MPGRQCPAWVPRSQAIWPISRFLLVWICRGLFSRPFTLAHNAAQSYILYLGRIHLSHTLDICPLHFQRRIFTQNVNRCFLVCTTFPACGCFYTSHFSAGAHLAFLRYCNTVAFLQEDDDICI